MKRNHDGEFTTPEVGGKILANMGKKSKTIVNGGKVVTMRNNRNDNDKQSLNVSRRVSKRIVKAKRQLDFVYDIDKPVESQKLCVNTKNPRHKGTNNDAQIAKVRAKKQRVEPEKNRKHKPNLNKTKTTMEIIDKDCFDGIKVLVNSDEEEELDYEHDLGDHDDAGSMGQDSDREVMNLDQENDSQTLHSTEAGLCLGASADEQMIMNNPHLKRLLNRMLDERIKEVNSKGESSGSQLLSCMSPNDPPNTQGKTHVPATAAENKKNRQGINIVKSPSDTTIYVPALKRASNLLNRRNIANNREQDLEMLNGNEKILDVTPNTVNKYTEHNSTRVHDGNLVSGDSMDNNGQVMTKILNFVDQLRIQDNEEESGRDLQQDDDIDQVHRRPKSSVNAPGLEEAQRRMERTQIETEKFKASVENPPGTNFSRNVEKLAQIGINGNAFMVPELGI